MSAALRFEIQPDHRRRSVRAIDRWRSWEGVFDNSIESFDKAILGSPHDRFSALDGGKAWANLGLMGARRRDHPCQPQGQRLERSALVVRVLESVAVF
jgi:hypothetical protein